MDDVAADRVQRRTSFGGNWVSRMILMRAWRPGLPPIDDRDGVLEGGMDDVPTLEIREVFGADRRYPAFARLIGARRHLP